MRRLVALLALLAAPRVAHAELYTFVDDEGVVHFTNIPTDPRAKPAKTGASLNTFEWKDELGKLRRVHRVDVTEYDELIVEAARYYTLPPALVKAVVAVESSFEPGAVSPAGAQGLMQLIPRTAGEVFVGNSFDPKQNVYGGTRYLRMLANQFDGDVRLTVAAYNAGPKAVERAGRVVPSIPETQVYVRRVLQLYSHYLKTWSAGAK